ncbi:MAG: uL13 family ribosomal protein [Candidatus Paceibacterota bacterium]
MDYKIDATNKKLGRIASEAATLLMGKKEVDFARNKLPNTKVTIVNASKASLDEKKMEMNLKEQYSGYPGGLKKISIKQTLEKKGYGKIFENAIKGMIPRNKLRPLIMKHLVITD